MAIDVRRTRNSVITERLLAATAMKTSGIFRNFYFTSHNVTSQMLCHPGEKTIIIAQKRAKNEHSRYLGENWMIVCRFCDLCGRSILELGRKDNNPFHRDR